MIQLNRSMMERYEIPERKMEKTAAVIFGADYLMLGAAARMLDKACTGAVCISREADKLRAQDCMFTMLVRGEHADGSKIDREEVVQSIVSAVNPETEFEDFLKLAETKPEILICHARPDDVETALIARFLFQCKEQLPLVLLAGAHPDAESKDCLRESIGLIAKNWGDGAWIEHLDLRHLLCDSLSAPLDAAESARAREKMNYKDDFICWAEPHAAFAVEGDAPACLASVCAADFEKAKLMKARVFDSAVFLCAAAGYLCGLDTFAHTLKDEKIRAWIGKAFYEELLPRLPEGKEEAIISAFERLENPLNHMPLLTVGRNLLGNFAETLLPAIRSYADENFEAPPMLSLGLAAAIMLYAGVRRDENGRWCVAREQKSDALYDDSAILEAFSSLAHDMPAESLSYAALADRSIWGCDLREIDGLEMRVMYDLSSIQRIGLRETIRLKTEE